VSVAGPAPTAEARITDAAKVALFLEQLAPAGRRAQRRMRHKVWAQHLDFSHAEDLAKDLLKSGGSIVSSSPGRTTPAEAAGGETAPLAKAADLAKETLQTEDTLEEGEEEEGADELSTEAAEEHQNRPDLTTRRHSSGGGRYAKAIAGAPPRWERPPQGAVGSRSFASAVGPAPRVEGRISDAARIAVILEQLAPAGRRAQRRMRRKAQHMDASQAEDIAKEFLSASAEDPLVAPPPAAEDLAPLLDVDAKTPSAPLERAVGLAREFSMEERKVGDGDAAEAREGAQTARVTLQELRK